MSVKLKEYNDLKDRLDKAQKKADQATGALKELKKQLKEKFDCSSLNEARTLLKKLEKQKSGLQTKFDDAVEAFEEKWDAQLDDDS